MSPLGPYLGLVLSCAECGAPDLRVWATTSRWAGSRTLCLPCARVLFPPDEDE